MQTHRKSFKKNRTFCGETELSAGEAVGIDGGSARLLPANAPVAGPNEPVRAEEKAKRTGRGWTRMGRR